MNDTSPHASMRWPPSSATLARTALVCAVAALVACGDGIGRPIRVAPEGEGGAAGAGGSPIAGDGGDVPPTPFCSFAASWPADLAALEMKLFDTINALRSGNGNGCAQYSFGNDPPLTLAPALRCSARLHAVDMSARSFF